VTILPDRSSAISTGRCGHGDNGRRWARSAGGTDPTGADRGERAMQEPAETPEQTEAPIDFDQAVVISPMIYPPRPILVVSGRKSHPMTVRLVPRTYIRRPEYWGIDVIGVTTAGPMPMITNIPYLVDLDLEACTGTLGVEVVGATMTEQLAVTTVTDEPTTAPEPA
jgi:hypothetical protein